MTIAIIDYGSGNLHSAAKAFEKAVAGKRKILVTDDAKVLKAASHIVLPGVGAFGDCKAGLDAVDGMIAAMEEQVRVKGKPFLGICVGMQLLADVGTERGNHKGFGWISGKVTALAPKDKSLKIPHMGWNELNIINSHPLFKGIKSGEHAYFVHSYHLVTKDDMSTVVTTEYGGKITAAVAQDNIMGVQFHPEKSQAVGLKLIQNFLRM